VLDAVHWSTVGSASAQDSEIVDWARANDRVVLTQDLDFSAILATTQHAKPSVIQIRSEDVNPDVIGSRVLTAIGQMKSELESGAIVSVDPVRARVRVLPLRPIDP
jgi:predicted nuclease of predicted toxin-antitoxin system